MAERLAIAQVTPFAWEARNEVSAYVAGVSEQLARRGHRVLVIAPSNDASLVRSTRRALRNERDGLLERADGAPLVLGVGEVLPFSPAARRAASLPVDVARTIEDALGLLSLDVVHVHEPFAPSAASVALRHSRALNVASFHAPTERLLSTQLARPLSRLLFGRLDARTASYGVTRDLMQRFFPAEYEVVRPGSDLLPRERDGEPVRLVLIAAEERAALRVFLRALRALPSELDWRATVFSPRPLAPPATLSRELQDRIEFLDAGEHDELGTLAQADIVVLASEGIRPAPRILLAALAAGAVPICSRLPAYEDQLDDGDGGLVFESGDVQTLAAHLRRAIAEPALRERAREHAMERAPARSWARVTDQLEQIYGRLAARRHRPPGDQRVQARLAARRLIEVDLHMHTDHSYDCATPVEVLLAEARTRGLGAIAITDHNEISGALDAREKADGLKVIVGEEIKTASQGEVIGLFLSERIPRGLTLAQTIAEIKRQGGVVYVPHPFDRLHAVPDYEHLLPVLGDVDALEVFNPRIAIAEFNDEAVRFAAKYRITAGAGSDAHVPQGLGSVRIRMRDFDGPQEFLQSLRDADIVRNPASCSMSRRSSSSRRGRCPGPLAGPRASGACVG